jgi:hypothetical protein
MMCNKGMWHGNIKQDNQSCWNGLEINEGSPHYYHHWKNSTRRTGSFLHISEMQCVNA